MFCLEEEESSVSRGKATIIQFLLHMEMKRETVEMTKKKKKKK